MTRGREMRNLFKTFQIYFAGQELDATNDVKKKSYLRKKIVKTKHCDKREDML